MLYQGMCGVGGKQVRLLSFVSRKSSATIYSNIKILTSFHIILVRHASSYLADFLSTDFDSIKNIRVITRNKRLEDWEQS